VTKVFVGELGHGVSVLLGSWTTYALIVSALLGFALMQSALKTGVLAPAMSSSNAMTLLASVALGVAVFGETLGHGGGQLIPAVIGLVIAVVGVARLASVPAPTGAGRAAAGPGSQSAGVNEVAGPHAPG
jgi:hypothetical protein